MRGLDTDELRKLWVAEGKFDEFTDLSHLFCAATDIVITDIVEI